MKNKEHKELPDFLIQHSKTPHSCSWLLCRKPNRTISIGNYKH